MTKNKIAGSLDTNTLLRLLFDDVTLQTKAVEKLLAKGGRFKVADAALIEMVFVMEKLYHFDRESVVENVRMVIHGEQFICNRILFDKAIPLYIQHTKLSIVDCVILVQARLNNATPLWTFDKDLVNLPQQELGVSSPSFRA